MAKQTVLRYKKGQKALFNGIVIRIVKQLGVQKSDFSSEYKTAVSYEWKIGKRWSGVRLCVHNCKIEPVA